MNVKSAEKKENSTVELVVEISGEEFDAAIEKVYKKKKNEIAIPGFRKGKAPRKVIEGMYGAGVFYEDAINDLYPAAYAKAMEEQNLKSVGYPKVDLVSAGAEGVTLKITITVEPEIKLGQYVGLTASKDDTQVTDEDVENELKPYIARATHLKTVEREAQNGDTAVIDFEGFDNGVAFEGGKGENYNLELGSHSFIEGFEEQVVGMKAGEEKDINVTFPEDYGAKELAGKPVVFKIKCHEVKESVVPAVDDEFAKDVSEFDTLEEFREDLKQKISQRKEKQAQKNFENDLLEQLVNGCEVEIPQAMKEFRADQMMEDYANRIQNSGMDFVQYLQMMGITADQLRENAIEGSENQIKSELALKAVAAAENLEVTEEDKTAEIEDLAKQYNMSAEQVKNIVPEDQLCEDILLRKATDFIVAHAEVGEPAAAETAAEEPSAEAKAEE